MYVHIKEILQSPGLWKDYHGLEEIDNPDLQTRGPIELFLHLTNAATRILVQGKIKADVVVTCVRCNEPYVEPIELKIEESFVPVDSPEAQVEGIDAFDILTYKEDRIVLDEMLRQNFLAAIPMKTICRHGNCLGLCDQCGVDLNLGPCGCSKEEIDPRWAKLGELYKGSASNPGLN